MKSFKQFIKETMRDYRNRPYNKITGKMDVSQYDDEYYDKEPDTQTYRDDSGKLFAMKHNLIPKKPIVSRAEDIIPKSDDVIHRGMSHDEYQNILKTGKISSKGTGNLGPEQEGLTYFTTKPSAADSYANSFAMNKSKPTPDKPAYIVSIKRPHQSKIKNVEGTGEHEVGVIGDIPADDIVAVHRGNVISYTPATKDIANRGGRGAYDKLWYLQHKKAGISSTAISRLHWEKIK